MKNIKRTFGAAFTILGIIGLIYTGFEFIKRSTTNSVLIVIGVVAILFFVTGIECLVKNRRSRLGLRRYAKRAHLSHRR